MKPRYSIRAVRWSDASTALSEVRTAVFIREQNVPEELEWDPDDERALHFLAEVEDGRPIGTARLLEDGHIGRMAVLEPWRGRGVGTAILESALAAAQRQGMEAVLLNAQTHAVPFYQRAGFETISGEFLDAGIPHVTMRRLLPRAQETDAERGDSSNS